MNEWVLRQKIFHSLYTPEEIGDSLLKEEIVEEFTAKMIVQRSLEYPMSNAKTLYYPGKSFCIAIIYAALLEKHFDADFYTVLDDRSLLFNNDPYFKPYSECKEIYDKIIEKFPFDLLESPSRASANFQKTISYFLKEFLLDESGKKYASADA